MRPHDALQGKGHQAARLGKRRSLVSRPASVNALCSTRKPLIDRCTRLAAHQITSQRGGVGQKRDDGWGRCVRRRQPYRDRLQTEMVAAAARAVPRDRAQAVLQHMRTSGRLARRGLCTITQSTPCSAQACADACDLPPHSCILADISADGAESERRGAEGAEREGRASFCGSVDGCTAHARHQGATNVRASVLQCTGV